MRRLPRSVQVLPRRLLRLMLRYRQRPAGSDVPQGVDGDPYLGKQAEGEWGKLVNPTLHDLLPEEQESLERILTTAEDMTDQERRTLLTNMFVSVLYYRRTRAPEVLDSLVRDLLATMRRHASPEYRKAVAGAEPPDLEQPPISVKGLLGALPNQY